MSSAGQIIGAVIGGGVGFFTPLGPFLGAQIGMTIGGYLDPGKGPSSVGPRLDDLTVQSASYGAPLARVYGTVSVVGNVIWLENNRLKETVKKTKSGGKGSSKKATSITYSYSATFAVALCKGPILGIRRLWIRSDLVYDAGSSDPATIAASNQSQSGWTLYLGSNTQPADPRLQATLGAANTPAWRGLAYLVFHDLELAKYGNSLMGAQVKAEVFQTGSFQYYPVTQRNMPVSLQWQKTVWDGSVFVRFGFFNTNAYVSADAVTWTPYPCASGTPNWTGVAAGNGRIVAISYQAGQPAYVSSNGGQTWATHYPPGGIAMESIAFGNGLFVITDSSKYSTSPDGVNWITGTLPENSGGNGSKILFNGSVFLCWMSAIDKAMTSPTGNSVWSSYSLDLTNHNHGVVKNGVFFLGSTGGAGSKVSSDGLNWSTYSVLPHVQSVVADNDNYLCFGNDSFASSPDGNTWTHYVGVLPGLAAQPYVAPAFNGSVISVASIGSIAVTIQPFLVSPSGVNLPAVVSAECLSSGLLSAGDIDVTGLTSTVRGYRIGSLGSIRSAIEPLQAAWPFDVVQRGYKLTFKPRGGAAVATIDAADLDARGDDHGAGVQITRTREVDSQLPRTLTIRYLDSAREYDAGSQYAERLSSATVRESVLDLPIVFDATEAAGKAEVLLYATWLARLQVAFSLPANYLHLEPADVVTLPTPEGAIAVRLVDVNYTSDGRVECRAALEHPAVYTPVALGAAPSTTGPTTLTPLGPATYALLDIPRISSVQDGVGFPVAMCGSDASWPGGVLMRSADGGATWDEPLVFSPPGATIGTAANSLGSVESRLVDAASQLTVTLVNGSLSSVSELSMLGGANHFAYGAQGRWEIIAARSCTLQSGSTYILSNMLRGRFGTEWAMALHAAGDTVVLLDSADLQVLPLSNGDIGAARLYRAITSGRDFSTDSDRAMTYAGANLKPLSPVYLNGSRHPSTNDWALEWLRRTRVGGEWRGGVGAALGEASEAYEIEVYADGSYTTVKRTMSASTPACAYPSADQVSDFGANQATLYLKVYQRSAIVGRGYPLTTSITR